MTLQHPDLRLETYEGLIHSTARRYEDAALLRGIELDDLKQILRMRIWRALESYDPKRSSLPVRRYVFGCMTNQIKDMLKRRIGTDLHLADLMPKTDHGGSEGEESNDSSRNALRFLSLSQERAFAELDENDEPELPSSLTPAERKIAILLIDDYTPTQIAQRLGCGLRHVRAHITSMRLKMGGEPLADPGPKAA